MPRLDILIASSTCGRVVLKESTLGPMIQLEGEAGPFGGRIIAAVLWQFIAFQQLLKMCAASGLATAMVSGSQPDVELFKRENSSRLLYLSISWFSLLKSMGSVFFIAFRSRISGGTSCVWQAFNPVSRGDRSVEWLVAARLVIGRGLSGGAASPPFSWPWKLTHFSPRLYL